MATAAKAALELYIPYQPHFVGKNKVQHGTYICWLLYHLEKEIIINGLEPPGLCLSSCLVFPADIGVVDIPHEDQCLRM